MESSNYDEIIDHIAKMKDKTQLGTNCLKLFKAIYRVTSLLNTLSNLSFTVAGEHHNRLKKMGLLRHTLKKVSIWDTCVLFDKTTDYSFD